MSNDSIGKTLTVAVLLCLVCSIIVSGAAVILKPLQQENKLLDKQQNILKAAGLFKPELSIQKQFETIEKQVIDIETGQTLGEDFDMANYDQRKAKKDPAQSIELSADIDLASLKRRAKYAEIYLVKNSDGSLDKVILPVSGYGLWSTLYGFLALESDLNTVAGLAFYDHAETPGLGGEVDNPKWKAQWLGKRIYGENGEVLAKLKKGGVNPEVELEKNHYVDGLSGATLTSNGVSNLIAFWFGENGFKTYLNNLAGIGLGTSISKQNVGPITSIESPNLDVGADVDANAVIEETITIETDDKIESIKEDTGERSQMDKL